MAHNSANDNGCGIDPCKRRERSRRGRGRGEQKQVVAVAYYLTTSTAKNYARQW